MSRITKRVASTESSPEIDLDDAWDRGDLGRDAASVRRSTPERDGALDAALGLQMISIRLPRDLLDQLKFIARHRGAAYQPLIREVLTRWAREELRVVAGEIRKDRKARSVIVGK